MDDAGAVVISSWEYCFYQTGVDIRNRVLTSWPYKRQWKRETFLHFYHFYLVPPSDSAFSQRVLFLPSPALELDLLVNQNDMACLLYRHVTAWCACFTYTCGEVALGPGLWMKSFFPGLSRPPVWFMTVGQDSGEKKPWHSLKIAAGCELQGQKHSFSPCKIFPTP